MSVKSKMTAIADRIRTMLGLTSKMGLDAMATHLGTAQNEVDTQAALIAQLRDILENKAAGVTPTGVILLQSNGLHNVAGFASAQVQVDAPLPTGIDAIAFGSFTLSADRASHTVAHTLGAEPNFYLVYAERGAVHNMAQPNALIAITALVQINQTSATGSSYSAYKFYRYANASGVNSTATAAVARANLVSGTDITINANSGIYLKAGVKYYWIAGVLNGLTYY